MAMNDELDELAARYADVLPDDAARDHALLETVRALDALYAAKAPAGLDARLAAERTVARANVSARLIGQQEVSDVRILRTAGGRRWTRLVATAAACMVVGLLAVLLIGGRGGSDLPLTGDGSLTQQGGLRMYASDSCPASKAYTEPPECSYQGVMPAEGNILKQRFADVLGVRNANVSVTKDGRLVIELPGVTDVRAAASLLAAGSFAIVDTGEQYLAPGTEIIVSDNEAIDGTGSKTYPIVFRGTEVDPASVAATTDRQVNKPVVTFAFAGSARRQFAQYTQEHIGQYLTIVVDDIVIESATIQSAIGGEAQIIGLPSVNDARRVASDLKYGPLPKPIRVVMVEKVLPGGTVWCPTPGGTALPVDTPTEPPNAPPSFPTPTPWPNPTPYGTPPPPSPSDTVFQIAPGVDPLVELVCTPPTPGQRYSGSATAAP